MQFHCSRINPLLGFLQDNPELGKMVASFVTIDFDYHRLDERIRNRLAETFDWKPRPERPAKEHSRDDDGDDDESDESEEEDYYHDEEDEERFELEATRLYEEDPAYNGTTLPINPSTPLLPFSPISDTSPSSVSRTTPNFTTPRQTWFSLVPSYPRSHLYDWLI